MDEKLAAALHQQLYPFAHTSFAGTRVGIEKRQKLSIDLNDNLWSRRPQESVSNKHTASLRLISVFDMGRLPITYGNYFKQGEK